MLNTISKMHSKNVVKVLLKRQFTKPLFAAFNYSTETVVKDNDIPNYSHALRTKMQAWHIHSYGNAEEVNLSKKCRIPFIANPKDVLVKVHTASVNPIDVAMLGGYGSTLLNTMRCSEIEFPLSLGRDFCGSVVHIGQDVNRNIKPGQLVWGVVPVHRQGCHAEYVVVSDDCISPKPNNLSNIEASSIPYAGLTAWNALYGCSGITWGSGPRGKRVLILGASGGVGSLAVQMLKAEGVQVVAVCSEDATKKVEELGAQIVLDYSSPDFAKDVVSTGPYDIIFDCAGIGSRGAGRYPWSYSSYITLSSPMLWNIDQSGLFGGMIQNAISFIKPNLKSISAGHGTVKWGFFNPSLEGLHYLARLVCRRQLKPNVESVFSFEEVPQAYEKVLAGHLRGKVVIEMP